MKELDVIIGRFARREVGSMTEKELVAFGALLDMPEPELLSWIVSGEEAPPLLQPWIDKLRNV
ncbi:MAG TPA: succinate dehydrogenase assembly factor 2 [Dongiaceae bacterium]|nr:succinate dehydrogenase assembly factor 2 [Dongiaceae bacterium]